MKQTRNWQCQFRVVLLHPFLKPQETIAAGDITFVDFAGFGMIFTEELHNMETAFVHIEMDIPLFKIGSVGFPDLRFRVQSLDGLPCDKAHTLAVAVYIDKKKLKFISMGFGMNGKHGTANYLPIQNDIVAFRTLSFKGADHMIPWYYFIVKGAKLLYNRLLEGNLDVSDEGLFLMFLQGD